MAHNAIPLDSIGVIFKAASMGGLMESGGGPWVPKTKKENWAWVGWGGVILTFRKKI